ncbi:autoinducer binding domain-containing protein [Bradyrhizobium sp. Tv2a-2]|uniref:autoinducer binding domain-containing protein n=1 Tax=Bradyrhizobium sp. Tv2a-2 TaxID=113395 RepID=UPI0032DFBA47
MHRAFQRFVDRVTESTGPDELQSSMADIAAALNFSSFAYLALPHEPAEPAKSPKVSSTYPPLRTARYLWHHYERFDLVVGQAIRHDLPFRWGLGLGLRLQSKSQRQLFEEAARFAFRCGFTIPIHDSRGAISALTFATNERRIDFERTIDEHANVLRVLAMFFHASARLTLRSDRVVDGVLLSSRQFECLEWSSRGKSAWEIGNILGISERTAVWMLREQNSVSAHFAKQ